LEKDGENHFDGSCERIRSVTESEDRKEHPVYSKRRKAISIGYILLRNCLLKRVIEGNLEGKGR
jgi:hypothetical protein